MSVYLRTVLSSGVIAALLASSATAAPPFFKDQNRSYGNSVAGSLCNGIENGTLCRDLSAWENYDVKGTYEYTEAAISNSRYQYDPSDGSWSNSYRYLSCPIDRNALRVNPNQVTLEAVLDPNALGCYSYGYIESWDPINEYQFAPFPFPGPMSVAGDWKDPFNYGESNSVQQNSYYDGSSAITTRTVDHCKYSWGDAMQAGGFSINERSYAFEGPYGPVGSSYNLSSCNTNSKQQ
jgi:hypothetical protein